MGVGETDGVVGVGEIGGRVVCRGVRDGDGGTGVTGVTGAGVGDSVRAGWSRTGAGAGRALDAGVGRTSR